MAWIKGVADKFGAGESKNDAIVALIRLHPELFGITKITFNPPGY